LRCRFGNRNDIDGLRESNPPGFKIDAVCAVPVDKFDNLDDTGREFGRHRLSSRRWTGDGWQDSRNKWRKFDQCDGDDSNDDDFKGSRDGF
jgi:hypothetical protein